jgi:hypothetical protein
MRVSMLALASALATGVVVAAGPQATPEPTLADVLRRAAAYVAEFQVRLSHIVAEETYVQDWTSVGPKGKSFGRRDLRSDLVLMRPAGTDAWAEFRDVFEVDGRAIRPRDDRVEQLLREPAGTSMHVATVLADSARFNVGVERNVNTPFFSLRFLETGNQPRFRFERSAGAAPTLAASTAGPADPVFRVSTEVWVIAYREVRARTLVRTAQRKDQPAHGRFWIEPATGRVLVSELVLDDGAVRATIEVSYQSEAALNMLVPVVMRERVEGRKTGSVVEGRATYGRFRRLEP